MTNDLTILPACRAWTERLAAPPRGTLLGHDLAEWRERTRRELGLDPRRPVIATGHQTLLWHPGILVKYLLTDAVAEAHGVATANLIVDQHVGDFGVFEVPVRRRDGGLSVRRIELAAGRPDVPMARHDAFSPPAPPSHLAWALDSVGAGVRRIADAVGRHRDAANAALQMGQALGDLMRRWVRPMIPVTAGDLLETTLARAVLAEMVRDPWRCARAYNRAVAAVPESGIGPLLIRDDYVELPLWRLRPDGRRMHAYDGDVERRLDDPSGAPTLMPRALMMTMLMRLGMCDLFVHGTGGARYDRAMEHWARSWLEVEPSPIAVATANVRLPLPEAEAEPPRIERAMHEARHLWHDPEAASGETTPGPTKRSLLAAIDRAPYRSSRRRSAFAAMHLELETMRRRRGERMRRAERFVAEARQRRADAELARRRDWPFPLYPEPVIDELARAVAEAVRGAPARATRR